MPARSLCDYRVNVSLPIHIMRESNAKKFEMLTLSTLTGLLVEQSDNSWGGEFARGPRIISLSSWSLCSFCLGWPSFLVLTHWWCPAWKTAVLIGWIKTTESLGLLWWETRRETIVANAVVTTTIRLRFDSSSTAYQRSLMSQWRNLLATVTLTYLLLQAAVQQSRNRP